MESLAKGFLEHGLVGLVIGSLFLLVFFLIRSHREERKVSLATFSDSQKFMVTQMTEAFDNNTQAISRQTSSVEEMTKVLHELKGRIS